MSARTMAILGVLCAAIGALPGCTASGGPRTLAEQPLLQNRTLVAPRSAIPEYCRRDPGLPQCLRERYIDRSYAIENRGFQTLR